MLNHPSLRAQISEIGVVDHWEYFINEEGAFFHSTENRINWVLAFEVLAKDSNSEEANQPVITYQKKMKTPAVALGWHLYRAVDPMTDALSFKLELEIEKAPVNPGQGQGILGALVLPAKKEAFTATFDANGQCIKVEIGAEAGVPGSKRKIRVDKHQPMELSSIEGSWLSSLMDQMLNGEVLLTQYSSKANPNQPVLTETSLKGFQLAHEYMLWYLQQQVEN